MGRAMQILDRKLLDEVVQRLVAALEPDQIYLYGSHAYGHSREDSDVDLYIVLRDSPLPPHKRAIEAYQALRGLFVPVEVKVGTQAEFKRRAQYVSSIERVIKEKGQVLYESQAGRRERVALQGKQ